MEKPLNEGVQRIEIQDVLQPSPHHQDLMQPDYNKWFYLQTDASAYGVGAVLLQEGKAHPSQTTNGRTYKPKLHPIAYYSATFTPTERNYDIYKRELLAVMKALAHWRPYLS